MAAVKHIPERTCIGCGKIKPQREMVRLVCTPEMNIEVDIKGRKPGRGAYLCQLPGCWQTGLKGNRLERALHKTLPSDFREKLAQDLKELFSAESK